MTKKAVELAILDVFERLNMPLSQAAIIEILKYSYTEEEIREGTRRQMFDGTGRLHLRLDWRLELDGSQPKEG